ncbi:MAG: DUF4340 domain-containing protein [Candidatus Parcubacteria bacterium]|nr:DUF4340 domain-containing protein [Candidatus Parcubacteria bacterium]
MTQKSKILLILLSVLIVLTAVYYIWQNPLIQKSNQASTEQLLTGNLDNLQKIEITKNSQTTTLEKPAEGGSASGGQSDKWVVATQNNAEANVTLIDNLISVLKDLKTGNIISQNQEKLASFDLSEDKATKLKLTDNKNNTILEILIGKTGPSYSDCYIKKPNSNNVLLIPVNLVYQVNQTDWVKPPEKSTTNTNSTK